MKNVKKNWIIILCVTCIIICGGIIINQRLYLSKPIINVYFNDEKISIDNVWDIDFEDKYSYLFNNSYFVSTYEIAMKKRSIDLGYTLPNGIIDDESAAVLIAKFAMDKENIKKISFMKTNNVFHDPEKKIWVVEYKPTKQPQNNAIVIIDQIDGAVLAVFMPFRS